MQRRVGSRQAHRKVPWRATLPYDRHEEYFLAVHESSPSLLTMSPIQLHISFSSAGQFAGITKPRANHCVLDPTASDSVNRDKWLFLHRVILLFIHVNSEGGVIMGEESGREGVGGKMFCCPGENAEIGPDGKDKNEDK